MNCLNLSQIGLIMDMIGVILLFMYGLPSKYKIGSNFTDGFTSDKQKLLNRKVRIGSYTGLSLMLLGFIFQFVFQFL